MHTPEQILQTTGQNSRDIAALQESVKSVIQNSKDIVALRESVKSAHNRINEMSDLTSGVHRLAANMENLTAEVKRLAEKFENGFREQGKRIGETETGLIKLLGMEKDIIKANDRLDKIEKEPADKWKALTAQIIGLITAAVVGGVIMAMTQ